MAPLTIRLLGPPAILDGFGRPREVRGHQAWATFAKILLARAPLDRRALAEELFPDTVDPLGSLRWCLAALRKALDDSESLKGDPLEANLPADAVVDIWRLDDDDFDLSDAGPLLQGVEPRASSEFSTWLLIERERIGSRIDARIRRDALRSLSVSDNVRALSLAQLAVRRNALDESAHVLLIRSLALAGRHAAALEHLEATEKLFVAELGVRPSEALRSAARRTVASPPGGVSPSVFVNSLIQSGLAALAAGAVDAGIDCLRQAAREAETIRDLRLDALARLELGGALVHAVRGFDDEGSVLLHQAADIAKGAGYGDLASKGFRELGYVEALAGRRPTASKYLEEAATFASGAEERAGILAVTGFNLVDWGRLAQGMQAYCEAIELARSAGNRRWEIWSLGIGARGLLAADDLDEADVWLGQCLRLVEEQRWMAFLPWPATLQSECRLRRREDPAQVRPRLEEIFALSCQIADPCWEGAAARALAMSYGANGQFDIGLRWLADASDRCLRKTDSYLALQVDILATRAEFCKKVGDTRGAKSVAYEWVALAARTHMDAQIAKAAAYIAENRFAAP